MPSIYSLYNKRAKTPYNYNNKNVEYYKNISIISFLPKALKKYSQMKMGKIERIEGIELIRALENNLNLGTFVIKGTSFSVDVNQDLIKVIDVMPKNLVRKLY